MPHTLRGYRVYTNLKILAYAWKVRITLINLPLDNQQDISDLSLSFFTLLNYHKGDFPLSSLKEEKTRKKILKTIMWRWKSCSFTTPFPPPLPFYQVSLAIHSYPFVFLGGERQEGGTARSIPMSAYGNTDKLEQKVGRNLGKISPTGIKPVVVVQEL